MIKKVKGSPGLSDEEIIDRHESDDGVGGMKIQQKRIYPWFGYHHLTDLFIFMRNTTELSCCKRSSLNVTPKVYLLNNLFGVSFPRHIVDYKIIFFKLPFDTKEDLNCYESKMHV